MSAGSNAGFLAYVAGTLALSGYFGFAAVQGDLGVLARMELTAERDRLVKQEAQLSTEITELRNLTRRLSDHYLDLDLLDERARRVLGMRRADEMVLR